MSLVDGDLWGLAWTADSRHLVFASGRLTGTSGTAKTLWRIPAAEGARPRPVSVGDDATAPAIPSRGDRLAFVRNTLVVNLWLAALPEAGVRRGPSTRFAPSTRSDWNPHYSPDGSRVAFESVRTGESAIWVSAADGSNLMQVFSARRQTCGHAAVGSRRPAHRVRQHRCGKLRRVRNPARHDPASPAHDRGCR